jgi:hypothetical protein
VNAVFGLEMAFRRTRTANAVFGLVWFGVRKVHELNVPTSNLRVVDAKLLQDD